MCCNSCPPGKHMVRRSRVECEIECQSCTDGRYNDIYNVKLRCNICENCNKSNMEYKTSCSVTRNAVCRCKAGFRCSDQQCTECIPVPTTKPTTAFKPFASTPRMAPPSSVKDSMWYLVIITLLLVVIALAVTKLKPFLRWIRSKEGYLLAEKITARPETTTEDEGVSKPVQEMCGKCDQPIDVSNV
ncbi:tumor necrosis factor receptor superfamily member 6 [Scomber japonicus]|uniref:tumor necrosis factor receptor superfamily member 6 n=1 Tax=Scomber japonicus TaxID=13676 RepID=UPI002305A24E|nr:tumor necrosis factor receptor superfamily member 6 [Scomber japonicus]